MATTKLHVYLKDDEPPLWIFLVIGIILCGGGVLALTLFDLHDSYWPIAGVIGIAIGGLVILSAAYRALGRRGTAACTIHRGGMHFNIEPPVYIPWPDVKSATFDGEGDTARLKVVTQDNQQVAIKVNLCAVSVNKFKSAILDCSSHPDLGTRFLMCPVCHFSVDSLKEYSVANLLLLFIVAASRKKRVIACPSCMRSHAMQMLAGNLLSANLVWPIIVLPWGLSLIARSFSKGHSRSVLLQLSDPTMGNTSSGQPIR